MGEGAEETESDDETEEEENEKEVLVEEETYIGDEGDNITPDDDPGERGWEEKEGTQPLNMGGV